jgi:hypothetical protein
LGAPFSFGVGVVGLTLRWYQRLGLRGAGVGLGFGFGLLVLALASAMWCLPWGLS